MKKNHFGNYIINTNIKLFFNIIQLKMPNTMVLFNDFS